MLVVNANGEGQGLNDVKPNEVTYEKIKNIIGGYTQEYPFKMVYKGKKYWMVANENGMMFNEQSVFTPFTCGMMGMKFEYHNGSPARNEDLMFNGIKFLNPMLGYVIGHFGPMVFIEDVDGMDTYSDYWGNVKAVA